MGKHKNKHNLKTLLVVILLSGIFLGCSLIVSPDLSVDHMVRKLLWPLWRLILLIGNIVAFPIRALRHQLPRYVGIFSTRMGLQILLMGQGVRILSLAVVGMVYFYIA